MKIKLLCDLPVAKKYGMTEGRVLEVELASRLVPLGPYWWVMDGAERVVGVLRHEAEVVEAD